MRSSIAWVFREVSDQRLLFSDRRGKKAEEADFGFRVSSRVWKDQVKPDFL